MTSLTGVFRATLQKKDSECCKSIVQQNLSPHDLNDSKWSQMTPNDFNDPLDDDHYKSFEIIWRLLSHEATKLSLL